MLSFISSKFINYLCFNFISHLSDDLGSLVRCDFDTAVDGGTITFTVDGKIYADAVVKNIYQLLGGNEIFPCVSVCPLDPLTEQEEGNTDDDNECCDNDDYSDVADDDVLYNYYTNH